jgi:pyruvate formate lyase activating enzyme
MPSVPASPSPMAQPSSAAASGDVAPRSAKPTALRVGGLSRLSSVDWPGQLAATVFTQGCPWDCGYCHNPQLLSAESPANGSAPIAWQAVSAFLKSRVGLLDGVVFSGGEPLAQRPLPAAIAEARALGFPVALHTGGAVPARFAEVLPTLAWVGFDVKAPRAEYERITRVSASGERAFESLRALIASGVGYEVRTTVHPDLLGEAELLRLAEELRECGVRTWVLQRFRADGTREDRPAPSTPVEIPPALAERLAEGFSAFSIRG